MKLIVTDRHCPKCDAVVSLILEVPYFRRITHKKVTKNKKTPIMDATGFLCTFCDSKWTLDEVFGEYK